MAMSGVCIVFSNGYKKSNLNHPLNQRLRFSIHKRLNLVFHTVTDYKLKSVDFNKTFNAPCDLDVFHPKTRKVTKLAESSGN